MQRTKYKRNWAKNGIIISTILLVACVFLLLFQPNITQHAIDVIKSKASLRPSYCIDNNCIDPTIVFRELPPFPKDFNEVDIMVENNQYPIAENFSKDIPDKNYYLQPEFYPSWEDQGVPLYTEFESGYSPGFVGIIGYGSYPGDIVVDPIMPGQNFLTITYWHTSWAIAKFQGMSLIPTYPANGETQMGLFVVKQNPSEVKKYFNVEIIPNTILLDPTYPLFGPEWAKKIRIKVHVKENTPPGKYLIGITPVDPPKELQNQWIREHRLKYTTVSMAGIGRPMYQIFVNVV